MASKVNIINGALIAIGQEIVSDANSTEKRARIANERFDTCRDAVLRAFPWNFATKRATITPTGTPDFGFTYSFAKPSDFIRLIETEEDIGALPYKVEGQYILSDEATISIRYVARIEQVGLWPADFCQAMSHYLAAELATALAGESGKQMAQTQFALFQDAINEAKASDANEDERRGMEPSRWSNARFGGITHGGDPTRLHV